MQMVSYGDSLHEMSNLFSGKEEKNMFYNVAAEDDIFLIYSQKISFDISCKLSPNETIFMKCQTYFLGNTGKILYNVVYKCFT